MTQTQSRRTRDSKTRKNRISWVQRIMMLTTEISILSHRLTNLYFHLPISSKFYTSKSPTRISVFSSLIKVAYTSTEDMQILVRHSPTLLPPPLNLLRGQFSPPLRTAPAEKSLLFPGPRPASHFISGPPLPLLSTRPLPSGQKAAGRYKPHTSPGPAVGKSLE